MTRTDGRAELARIGQRLARGDAVEPDLAEECLRADPDVRDQPVPPDPVVVERVPRTDRGTRPAAVDRGTAVDGGDAQGKDVALGREEGQRLAIGCPEEVERRDLLVVEKDDRVDWVAGRRRVEHDDLGARPARAHHRDP